MTVPPHVVKYIEKEKKKKEDKRERPTLHIEEPKEKHEKNPIRHGWDYREPKSSDDPSV